MKTAVGSFHEDLTRGPTHSRSSNRAFGLVFTGVFLLLAIAPVFAGREPRWWAAWIAAPFLFFALAAPGVLGPLNAVWAWIGAQLHRIVSPIVLGMLFAAFTIVARLSGRRRGEALGLRFDPSRRSYWVDRLPPGPPAATLRNQF